MFKSIRWRLTSIVVVLAIFPLAAAGLVIGIRSYNSQTEQSIDFQTEIARGVAKDIEAFVDERELELRIISEARDLQSASPETQNNLLLEILGVDTAFDELAVLNSEGHEVAHQSRLAVISPADYRDRGDRDEFLVPTDLSNGESQTYYGPVRVDEVSGELVMTISIGLEDLRSGAISHVLAAELRLQQIGDLLRNIESTEHVYLVDDTNRVIAHTNPSVVLRDTRFDVPDEAGIGSGLDENNVVIATYPIALGSQTIHVVTERNVEDALALAINTAYTIVGVMLIVLVVAAATGFYAVQRVVRPLEDLSTVAQEIEGGDLNQQAPDSDLREIGALSSAFNSMTSRLRAMVQDLEQRVADRTRDLELAVDLSRQITSNLAPERLLSDVVTETRRVFDLYAMHVVLLDDQAEKLVLKAAAYAEGSTIAQTMEIELTAEKSLLVKSARTRQTVIVNDVAQDYSYMAVEELPKTRSEMVIPIIRGERLLGVLDIQSEKLNRFSQSDERVMTVIARQLAVALENAQLFAEQVQVAEELRQLDQLKSQFLASMSHELRTPLNAIINFTQFILNGTFGETNERQTETLQKVIISGKHLLSLINDILDFSKIESGMLQLFVQEVSLPNLIKVVQDTTAGLEVNKNVEIQFHVADKLPETISGDKRRLRQILLNLMSNAAKFTQEGSITFKAWVEGNNVLFSVTDTGSGISAEDMTVIFEPFQQTTVGKGKGTGLGLPISRHLAEAHGGKLWVVSEPGKGSTFYVSLPLEKEVPIHVN